MAAEIGACRRAEEVHAKARGLLDGCDQLGHPVSICKARGRFSAHRKSDLLRAV